MQRNVSTTVRVKLHSLTNRKTDLLAREHEAFQTAVHGGDADLYSATDQQASKVQRQKDPNPDTEQPVVLRNDVFNVSHDEDTVLSSWWVKVPVYDPEQGRGNSIWCPAHVPYKDEQLVREGDIRDSELVRRDGDWYVHLVVKRSVTVQDEYDDVLAIDMGARWVATSAFLTDRKTTFYGEEVRRIREHYKQLRKSIGKAKPRQGQQVVERIGDAEARKVDGRLHKIARQIVEDAEERNAVIVVGDLGRIRKDNDKGRYVNDKTTRCRSPACSTTSNTKPTTRVSTCNWSMNTTRRRRAIGAPARASVRRRDASSVPNVAGRQRRQEWCAEYRQTSLGQVLETAVRGGGCTGTARNAGHRPP